MWWSKTASHPWCRKALCDISLLEWEVFTWQRPFTHGQRSQVHILDSQTLDRENLTSFTFLHIYHHLLMPKFCHPLLTLYIDIKTVTEGRGGFHYDVEDEHWCGFTHAAMREKSFMNSFTHFSPKTCNCISNSGNLGKHLISYLKMVDGVEARTWLPSGDQDRKLTPPPPTRWSGTQLSEATSHT